MAQTSYQVTVTTAGTAVAGPDTGAGTFAIACLSSNTGNIFFGNDGSDDVSSSTGYEIVKDVFQVVVTVSNMNEWYFDAANNGDKAAIVKLGGEQMGVSPPAL